MSRPGPSRRRWLRLAIAIVCLAALIWTVLSLGPRQVLAVALRADPVWLALSLVPIALRFGIWAFKWKRMLARRASVPFSLALRILGAGSFANLTTPTAKLAGGIVRGALLHRRRGWPLSSAYGYAMADQVTNVLGHLLLFGLVSLGAAWAPEARAFRGPLLLAGAGIFAGLALITGLRPLAWSWICRPDLQERLLRLIPARFRRDEPAKEQADRLQRIFSPLLHDGPMWRTFGSDLLLAASAFFSICLANAMVLRSIGVETPLVVLCAAMALGYFAGIAVGIWGGVGVTEAALTGIYVQIGIPLEQAAAGALLHRAILYAVILLWGGYALSAEGGRCATAGVDHSGGSEI